MNNYSRTNDIKIATFYNGDATLPDLQRSLTKQQEDHQMKLLVESKQFQPRDRVRFNSIKLKPTAHFINHNSSRIVLNNTHIAMGVRMRLGLPPLPDFTPDGPPTRARCALKT